MQEKEKKKFEKQAKLKKILEDVAQAVDAGRIERTVELHGLKWVMMPLNDHESNWRNKYIIPGSLVSITTSMKAPTLAIGIRKIGLANEEPEPIEEFFAEEWEKLSSRAADILMGNEYAKQYYLAEMLFTWLSNRDPSFIIELWEKWQEMSSQQEEVDKQLGESLEGKETKLTSGVSSNTESMVQSMSSPSPQPQNLSTLQGVNVG